MNPHINGTSTNHTANGVHQAGAGEGMLIAIEVLAIKDGQSHFVRLLSPRYGGCMTHYFKGKGSRYCAGAECMYLCSKLEKTWKGYCAVEQWMPRTKTYRPYVLEMTERLEQDMRGIYARGQLWECYKHARVDGKAQPVQGKLQPDQAWKHLPPEFDWQAVVKNMYHCASMDFSVSNPLAARVVLAESQDDGPKLLQSAEETPPTPEQLEELHRRAQRFNASKRTPAENKRGT